MKKLFTFLILVITLSLLLISCGGNEKCDVCADDDGDGKCDACGGEVLQEELPLVVDGELTFSIVLADDVSAGIRTSVRSFQNTLSYYHGISLNVVGENDGTASDVEILVGNVKNRGAKYSIDGHTLGPKGYLIKLVGTKVVINGGSDETHLEAFEKFTNDMLKITSKGEIVDFTMKVENSVESIQSDFSITSLKIDGAEINEFKIFASSDNTTEMACANLIRQTVYETTGIYLDIVSSEDGEHLISIVKANDGNFTVTAKDKKLTFAYSHKNLLESVLSSFIIENIKLKRGKVTLSGELLKKDTSVVYYEDFGAEGDGETNDFEAIYKAHAVANEGGQLVKATPGKTYYISHAKVDGTIQSVVIKTNVDWTGAKFIIDDRKAANGQIFKVSTDSDIGSLKITNSDVLANLTSQNIGPGTTKIEIPKSAMYDWDGPVMIVLYNSGHKVFRRRSYRSSYNGDTQKELVLLDKDGNVDPSTPLMFNYEKVTQAYIYRLDPSRAITIEGGKFTTIASQNSSGYVTRNISVTRSYTTLKNIEHYVEGEVGFIEQSNGKMGAPYSGFFVAGSCTDVTFLNCTMTGRRYYDTGTYEFSANTANNVKLDGCVQSNFWVTVDENYNLTPAEKDTPGAKASQSSIKVNGSSMKICWGAGSSNYCKNLKYINSRISRYDAHSGVYNAEIIGCEITGIELTGWGKLTIEDTKWYSYGTGSVANALIYLRNDYGSTWNGEIVVKNVEAHFTAKNNATAYLFYHSYVNWFFGYSVAFPSITIDNLKCYDVATGELLEPGHTILLNSNDISATTKMHLPESHTKSNYSIIDADKDGFVDEPRIDSNFDGIIDPPCDLDGDGKIGNTSIVYTDAMNAAGNNKENGTYHPTSKVNLNTVKPPEFIKILNNTGKGSFTIKVKNTYGTVSNGGYHGVEEGPGGFFGSTKFYYSETDYFIGTNQVGQNVTDCFNFYN